MSAPCSHIRVRWLHKNTDDPNWLISELNADRYEIRKIELWADGRVGWADDRDEVGGTRLGLEPVPSVQEISTDTQFEAEVIAATDFEEIWRRTREANKC